MNPKTLPIKRKSYEESKGYNINLMFTYESKTLDIYLWDQRPIPPKQKRPYDLPDN